MPYPLRLLAVLAHPDDESLGFGGTLARYAAQGVECYLVTATRGEAGAFNGHRDPPEHPGAEALGRIREAELRAAAKMLGVRELALLDYKDQQLDRADPREAIGKIVGHIRRWQPQVVVTFDPQGSYGHPDHIAICQFTTAAAMAAADQNFSPSGDSAGLRPHAISKLYYVAWPESALDAYQAALRKLTTMVDGVEREGRPWSDWAMTTVLDTRAVWDTVWQAVLCHQSQLTAYRKLANLSPEHHEAIWGWQSYYRAFSTVNGGRQRESDLFEGLRD